MIGHYTGTIAFVPSPQAGADAWAAGVGREATKWAANIQATTKDQAGLAVAQQAALLSNFQQSISSGLWAQRVLQRGTAYWKSQSAKKSANYSGAAATGKDNYQVAAQGLYPYIGQLEGTIAGMASGTPAASDARMLAWSNGMRAVKGQFRA